MELHLFRHGQTNWNEERRVQGQSDSVLTDLGIEQAQQLGQRIQEVDFDQVFCSSSVRTRQTADHAFDGRNGDTKYLDSLREIHLGPWEGNLYADIEQLDPESFNHFWQEPHLFDVEGAETFFQLQQRAVDTVGDVLKDHHQQRVAFVSHGALIKALLCHFKQQAISDLWAPPSMHNCAHSIVRVSADGSGEIIQYADQPTP
jgi:broad specificity phosphatase PhoE